MRRLDSRVAILEAQRESREEARLAALTDEELEAEYAKVPAHVWRYVESLTDAEVNRVLSLSYTEIERRARAYRP